MVEQAKEGMVKVKKSREGRGAATVVASRKVNKACMYKPTRGILPSTHKGGRH